MKPAELGLLCVSQQLCCAVDAEGTQAEGLCVKAGTPVVPPHVQIILTRDQTISLTCVQVSLGDLSAKAY